VKLLDQLVEPRHVGELATETKLMREVNCLIEGAAVPYARQRSERRGIDAGDLILKRAICIQRPQEDRLQIEAEVTGGAISASQHDRVSELPDAGLIARNAPE
jgi:hypothetical protein